MTLNESEKSHFTAYLEETIRSNEKIIGQLEIIEPNLVKKYRAETLACKVVLAILKSTHSETIER